MSTPQRHGKDEPVWLELFDPVSVDHVCELLRDDHPGPRVSIRSVLLPMVDAYLDHRITNSRSDIPVTDIEAAERLRETAERVAGYLEGGASGPDFVSELRVAWLELIANAAGHHIYDGLPKRRDAGRKGGQAAKRRKLPPDDKIQRELESLIQQGRSERDARSVIHNKYRGIAGKTAINNALRRRG